MEKYLKRMWTAILITAVVLLSACGKEQAGNSGEIPVGNSGESSAETEYSWRPAYKEMGGSEWTSFQDIRFAGEFLYYEQVFFDVVNQVNVPVLKQYSLTEGRVLKERDVYQDAEDGSRRRIAVYAVQADGTLYIGYPEPEGTGCIADCRGALGIPAQSLNQQAAWEFVEYHLERQADNRFRSGFSTRISSLDRQMEEAANVSYYLDEEGNPLLDAEGRPVPKDLGGVGWSFEELISFRTATEEEVLFVRELIETARPARALDGRILDIIREEAEPFFQGQKSMEDVTGIIQSRVQLYLDGR